MATPRQIVKDISAGKFKSAYYFYGTEDFRISEAVKYVSRQFLPDKQLSLNCQRLDGRKTKAADLITELSTLPMLGEKQVFIVSDFQSFRPKELASILSLIAPQDPGRVVIFTSPSTKIPKKSSAFFKAISKKAEVCEFNKLNLTEVFSMVKSKLDKEGLTIEPEALKLFGELISGNRGALESEVKKMLDYKNSGETITKEDVHTLTNGYEVFQIFELADYVVNGNVTRVMTMLKALLAEGNAPVVLVNLLQQHFSSLYLVKNGKAPVGNRNFLIYKFKPQAAKYSNTQLEKTIIQIAEADSQLRHSDIKPELTLEVLAIEITGLKNN